MSTNRNRKNKIVKFRRLPKINIGVGIFLMIFLYLVASVVIYIFKDNITIYEVKAGSLSNDTVFNGIAAREENEIKSQYSGYINYFLKDDQKAGVGTMIYSVDETGRVNEMIAGSESGDLSDEGLNALRNELDDFSMIYNDNDFSNTYEVSEKLSTMIYEYKMDNVIDNLSSYINDTGSDKFFYKVKADKSGIVSYMLDQYSSLNDQNISNDCFNKDGYKSSDLRDVSIVNEGSTAYKLLSSETWSIYIQLTDNQKKEYADKKSVHVKFLDYNIDCQAGFYIVTNENGSFGKITLDQYMVEFASERYINLEIFSDTENGLKIPVTSVTEKEFFTIPIEYLTTGGDSNQDGFIRKTYDTSGKSYTEFVTPTIYNKTDKYCFVDKYDFKVGDCIIKTDSEDVYIIGTVESLKGVFCVNKGYSVFRKVEIVDKNDEYYIVKKGTTYGLSIYDQIVLDADTVSEDKLIN